MKLTNKERKKLNIILEQLKLRRVPKRICPFRERECVNTCGAMFPETIVRMTNDEEEWDAEICPCDAIRRGLLTVQEAIRRIEGALRYGEL